VKREAGFELGALSLDADSLEHGGLQVDRDDATGRTDEARELQSEEPGTTTEVESGDALSHVGREKAARALKPPSDPIVERTGESDRADLIA
jgi:hypothetical protein